MIISWYCKNCILPNFTDFFFIDSTDIRSALDTDYLPSSQNDTFGVNTDEYSVFDSLRESRKKHPNNFAEAYININSVKYKFNELKELLDDKIVDLLVVAETKLDSFNDNLFKVEGY